MTKPVPDRAAYADITVPCHVVSFAHDLVAPSVYERELVGSIPGVTFDVVDDAGHFGSLGAVKTPPARSFQGASRSRTLA